MRNSRPADPPDGPQHDGLRPFLCFYSLIVAVCGALSLFMLRDMVRCGLGDRMLAVMKGAVVLVALTILALSVALCFQRLRERGCRGLKLCLGLIPLAGWLLMRSRTGQGEK